MNQDDKLRHSKERQYSAHHMLIAIARYANDRAKKQEDGWRYDALTAITFSALAIEALANAFGERKVENWKDFENSSPTAKLRVLTGVLAIPYEMKTEPWETARWLARIRNQIAHAKPQLLREDTQLTQAEVDKHLFGKPESKLEREITLANAMRSVDAAMLLKDVLCESIPPQEAMGLVVDGWSGSIYIPQTP